MRINSSITQALSETFQAPRTSLPEQIAGQLQEMITSKPIPVGSQLPSERELAQALSVSRVTVHQAMILLEQNGLVSIKPGSGIFVTDVSTSHVADSIQRYYTFNGCSHNDLISFREIIEPEMAAMAAAQIQPEELARLHIIVNDMETAFEQGDFEQCARLDAEFHEILAIASRNLLILSVVSGLQKIMQTAIYTQLSTFYPKEGILSHRPILEALLAHDPEVARLSMKNHMKTTRSQLLVLSANPGTD